MKKLMFVSLALLSISFFACKKKNELPPINEKGCVSDLNGWEFLGKTQLQADFVFFELMYGNTFSNGFDLVYRLRVPTTSGGLHWRAYRAQFDLEKKNTLNNQINNALLYSSTSLNETDLYYVWDWNNSLVSNSYNMNAPATIESVMLDAQGSLNPNNAYVFNNRKAKVLFVNSTHTIYNSYGAIFNGIVTDDNRLLYLAQTLNWNNNDFFVGKSNFDIKQTNFGGVQEFWFDSDYYNFTPVSEMSGGDNMTKILFIKGVQVGNKYVALIHFDNGVSKQYEIDMTDFSVVEIGVVPVDLHTDNCTLLSNGSLLYGYYGGHTLSAIPSIQIRNGANQQSVNLPQFNTDFAALEYRFTEYNDALFLLVYYKSELYFYKKNLL